MWQRLTGKDPDAGKDWGQEENGVKEDEMVGWHHQLNGHELEKTQGDYEVLFDHFQFTSIHGPNIPGSYTILLFTASYLASITSHIHNWVLFLLWPHPFILSGVVSPLISCSILGTYWPGEFIFQCPIFLPFHTVHGVLKARMRKSFAIPFFSGPHLSKFIFKLKQGKPLGHSSKT